MRAKLWPWKRSKWKAQRVLRCIIAAKVSIDPANCTDKGAVSQRNILRGAMQH